LLLLIPPPWRFASRGGEVSCTAQHFIYALAVRLVSKLKKDGLFYILNINKKITKWSPFLQNGCKLDYERASR